ncbi:unnamed protein product [Parnassius mnemosyne]|uniref:Uncharacterized protein n=1 Tax=Parnassius mnemosyne TaxID=213953 RepID=A0AAV1KL30_9NEOP
MDDSQVERWLHELDTEDVEVIESEDDEVQPQPDLQALVRELELREYEEERLSESDKPSGSDDVPLSQLATRRRGSVGKLHATLPNSGIDYNNINMQMSKFWELEEVPLKRHLNPKEKACEAHFINHTFHLESGRFSISLPLKDSPSEDCLGESYTLAKKRLLTLEKRFRKQPDVKLQYIKFIREYEELEYLTESTISKPDPSYFLCHHAVFKNNSESTMIRVVFHGSAPTSSGHSINDILMVSPNIQKILFSILIRARQHKYILTSDVEKIYRQVLIHEQDRNMQLILRREDESLPMKTLTLNTVTYGITSSSYLSTRCLWQIGEECSDERIKTIIQHDFLVDDLITGSDDDYTLIYIQQAVTSALKRGCFNLRKFNTNLPLIFHKR